MRFVDTPEIKNDCTTKMQSFLILCARRARIAAVKTAFTGDWGSAPTSAKVITFALLATILRLESCYVYNLHRE